MRHRILYAAFLFFVGQFSVAQSKTLLVDYSEKTEFKTKNYTLYIDDTLSYWHYTGDAPEPKDTPGSENNDGFSVTKMIIIIDPDYEKYPYKNFVIKDQKNDTLYFIVHRYQKPDLYVTDTLHPMKWEILTNEHKTVLGYPCTAARTRFRGRTYKAWFTPEIPVSDGPWKFGGLPGLILEVEEPEYHFTAKHITFNPSTKPELPPLHQYRFIPWSKYVQMMRDFYDRRIKEDIARNIREGNKYDGSAKVFGKEIIHPIYSKNGVIIPGTETLNAQKKQKKQTKKKKRKRFLGIF